MPLREIPPVHQLTSDPIIASYDRLLGHGLVRSTVQLVLDEARSAVRQGAPVAGLDGLRASVLERLATAQADNLVRVINATGVLLHTNFGRAPIAPSALAMVERLGSGYTNLEYNLATGARGNRYERITAQLRELSGAQAALVVNNCAAAVLLVLDTFARDREVVVSRGQLIEIGGGFRLPDVLRKSGARLVEVGTTNKTYPLDYRNAWTPQTALFMRTHPSNYRIEGFVANVDAATLAALAKELGVISFEDLGSGALIDLTRFGLPHEPTVKEQINAGLDLVAVSGDKLLGGPQCGIIFGRNDLIDMMKRNPLLRALRVDKLTLAALGGTLELYLTPDKLEDLPLMAMLHCSQQTLRERAQSIRSRVSSKEHRIEIECCDTESATGGGTLPLARIPSAGLRVRALDGPVDSIAERLRRHQPPIVGRIEADAVILDLRAVATADDDEVARALSEI